MQEMTKVKDKYPGKDKDQNKDKGMEKDKEMKMDFKDKDRDSSKVCYQNYLLQQEKIKQVLKISPYYFIE